MTAATAVTAIRKTVELEQSYDIVQRAEQLASRVHFAERAEAVQGVCHEAIDPVVLFIVLACGGVH